MSSGKPSLSCRYSASWSQVKLQLPFCLSAFKGRRFATMIIRSEETEEGLSSEEWSSSSSNSETLPGTVITLGRSLLLVLLRSLSMTGKFPDARSSKLVYDLEIIFPCLQWLQESTQHTLQTQRDLGTEITERFNTF